MIQQVNSKSFYVQVLFDLEVFIKRTSLPRLRLVFWVKRIQFKVLMLQLARDCSLLWSIGVSGVPERRFPLALFALILRLFKLYSDTSVLPSVLQYFKPNSELFHGGISFVRVMSINLEYLLMLLMFKMYSEFAVIPFEQHKEKNIYSSLRVPYRSHMKYDSDIINESWSFAMEIQTHSNW